MSTELIPIGNAVIGAIWEWAPLICTQGTNDAYLAPLCFNNAGHPPDRLADTLSGTEDVARRRLPRRMELGLFGNCV